MHPLSQKLLDELKVFHLSGLAARGDKLITDYLKSRAEWLKKEMFPEDEIESRKDIDQAFELSVGEKCEHQWELWQTTSGTGDPNFYKHYKCSKCREDKIETVKPIEPKPICPLLSLGAKADMECMKQECAWYYTEVESCCLFALSKLINVTNYLGER